MDMDKLAAPFPPETISWRAQNVTKDGTKALALAYIDARDVMNRLDEICKPWGWTDSYVESAKGRVIGTISIRIGDDWVSKSDGAGDTDVEGDKGAISDSFKRTAVKWGIGRYLYELGNVWAECECATDQNGNLIKNAKGNPQWRKWTARGQAQLNDALNKLAQAMPQKEAMIGADDRDVIKTLCEASGVTIQSICEGYKIQSLDFLTAKQSQSTIRNLKKRIEGKAN